MGRGGRRCPEPASAWLPSRPGRVRGTARGAAGLGPPPGLVGGVAAVPQAWPGEVHSWISARVGWRGGGGEDGEAPGAVAATTCRTASVPRSSLPPIKSPLSRKEPRPPRLLPERSRKGKFQLEDTRLCQAQRGSICQRERMLAGSQWGWAGAAGARGFPFSCETGCS